MRSTDPHSYLQISAAITAEDDTHVVISLRVEKSWLQQNLLFLGALMETGVSMNRDKFDPPPAQRRAWRP